ncbi:MAG TPA: EthD family reductase [Roseiarcus sp.]|nr:EthD family reductase [Roseiarcus sp.]
MISVLVLYANEPGSRFDMDYYTSRHLPFVRQLLEPMGMRSLTFTRELAFDPGASAQAYRLVAELRFDDRETTRTALEAHGAETQADIENFTNVAPVILVAELTEA